jgi:DNA-binding transcriptional MocR family regulator
VVRDLLLRHDALTIPGTAFLPEDRRMLRVSIANVSPEEITEFASRLSDQAGRSEG